MIAARSDQSSAAALRLLTAAGPLAMPMWEGGQRMMRTAAPVVLANGAAADRIVTAHRGAVEACSKRADTFRSTATCTIRVEPRQKWRLDRTTGLPDGYVRMTVSTDPYALIVDDDPIILMDLGGILSDAGFRCVEADHGDAAVAMLPGHADNITLLFSDVEMPGDTDGFALARHVSSTYPWIEIVIASRRIKPEPGDMPENAAFIGKPFSARMVHDHLRERLPDGKKPEPLKKAV